MLVPTLTPLRADPCVPGATAPELLAACPVSFACTVDGVSQPRFGKKRLGVVACPLTPPEASVCCISGATRWE